MSDTESLTVALFTDNYGPGHSGLLYAVQFIEEHLLAAGHKVVLVAPESEGPNPYASHPKRREIRLPSVYVPGLGANFATSQDFEFRLNQILANPPDVIHVQGLGPIGILGWWAAKQGNIPLITTWHTDLEAYADDYWPLTPVLDAAFQLLRLRTGFAEDFEADHSLSLTLNPKEWPSRKNLMALAKMLLEDSQLVTTPSRKTAKRVLALAPQARVMALPNGADPLPDGPPIPRAAGPRLLYVGRIAPEKGLPLLLDAFDIVRDVVPTAELMIVGDWKKTPTLRPRLKKAAKHGGVRLVGQVSRAELGPYYASADVFAFPSLTDTQALVLHEAAHAGLPIVLADPDLRLVVDEGVNAMVAPPEAGPFAGALLSMLRAITDDGFRTRAQARSRELAGQWTIARQSKQVLDLYRSVVDAAAPHAATDVH